MAAHEQPPSGSRYVLGVDIGTTYTAAAVHLLDAPQRGGAGGRWHMVELGTRAATIPSWVLIRADGVALVGEAAERRALIEPTRAAREFKRRLGDSVPLLLGGSPFSAEALTAEVLRYTIAQATERYGLAPHRLALSYPANWGPFKLDVLRAAVSLAGQNPARVTFISEPEAAALAYAAHDRPPRGAMVAVYDLGGGTFDVAVLQDDGSRYRLVGEPGGVERLGGIDFDEALFRHVLGMVETDIDLTSEDPPVIADLMALRTACVAAKEALSVETDTTVAVRLGAYRQEVRVVRSEFEALIRPTLHYTIDALSHTLAEAGLTPADLHAVLLVGGSSRIPLVGQLVAGALGRPVALDIHPKHVVALGAALVGAGAAPADLAEDAARVGVVLTDDDAYGPAPAASTRGSGPATPPVAQPIAPVDAPAPTPTARFDPASPPTPTSGRLTAPATPPNPTPAPAPPPSYAPPSYAPPSYAPSNVLPSNVAPANLTPPNPSPPQPASPNFAPPNVASSNPAPTRVPPTNRRSGNDESTSDLETEVVAERGNGSGRTSNGSPKAARRRAAAVGVGAFAGLVALAGFLVLRDAPDANNDAGAAAAGQSIASSLTATPASNAPAAKELEVSPALDEFLNFANGTDKDLLRVGNVAERGMATCRSAMDEAAATFGEIPLEPPRIPLRLKGALADSGKGVESLEGKIIDTFFRRLQACVNGDQASYDQLQAEDEALRSQEPTSS